LIPLVVLSISVTITLFLFAYIPQVLFLALFHRQGSSFFSALILTLGEINLVVAIFFEAFLVDHAQVDTVDAVLVARGHEQLVRTIRVIDPEQTDCVKSLGPRDRGAKYAPFSFQQIIEFVLLLPLNLVPYVGVPLFILGTGYRAGPLLQWRYYKLKNFDSKQRKAFVNHSAHRGELTYFGTVSMILQLIPVLSLVFLITTAVGSGLWAADLEDAAQKFGDNTDNEVTMSQDAQVSADYQDDV